MQNSHRMDLSNKKRIVIKIGSTSLTHPETGAVNLGKIEQLARQISDLKGRGKEVVLVTSGAVAAGKQALENYKVFEQLKTAFGPTISPRRPTMRRGSLLASKMELIVWRVLLLSGKNCHLTIVCYVIPIWKRHLLLTIFSKS